MPAAVGRSLLTPLLVAATTLGFAWVMLLLDTLEEKGTSPGYARVPDDFTLISAVVVALVFVPGLAALLLWQLRVGAAVVPALVAGLACAASGPAWSLIPDGDGRWFVWPSVVVGVLLALTATWLLPASRRQWPEQPPFHSWAPVAIRVVGLLFCALCAGTGLVVMVQTNADFDLVGRFEEEEVGLAFLAVAALVSTVFLSPALNLLGSLGRRWPRHEVSTAPRGAANDHAGRTVPRG